MYHDGRGMPQDYKEAVKWYHQAAEQGNADAQFKLGRMYANGYGVPQDYVQAHMWFNLSQPLLPQKKSLRRHALPYKKSARRHATQLLPV